MTPRPGKTRYTFQDVRDAYVRERRMTELEGELPAVLLYRPISHRIAPILLRLGLPPLAVTMVSASIVLTLIPVASVTGSRAYLYVAALGLLFHILDCVDGDMARTAGRTSELGRLVDGFVDQCYWISLLASFGILVDRAGGTLAGWGLVLGLVLPILVILHRQTRDNFALGFGEPPLEAVREWPPKTLLDRLRVATAGLENLYIWALVGGGALGILGEVFLGIAIYVASVFLVAIGAVFRKAAQRREDPV
ncbi:CDP-alcohol phosphatidyltransferase family protein [Gemmatimonadota bacterium]